ncbi:hypothetical protein T09_8102 [Trichinella sp. T9]|nr:hypothetical protein T09_8102 [Trichinella sp. T9]
MHNRLKAKQIMLYQFIEDFYLAIDRCLGDQIALPLGVKAKYLARMFQFITFSPAETTHEHTLSVQNDCTITTFLFY